MRQDLVKEAQNNITLRRLAAEQDYISHMRPLFDDPEYQKINKALIALSIQNAKAEANGEKADKTQEQELQTQIGLLKKKHHLENVCKKVFCKKCNDEGLINGQLCSCLKKEISQILLKESGFEKLESFSDSIETSGDQKEIYTLMKEWCNKASTKTIIYLSGPAGVGKTHLASCMANELIENGKMVRLVTAFQMNQDFKSFQKSHNEDLINRYIYPEVLFIDDLGTEPKYKDVTIEFLYLVINERKMRKLPTIITSNLNLADLRDHYDERIYSRIVDRNSSITYYLDGEDRRIKK